ncbi:kinase-like protein [Coniophora puteana RWD-64-598 SS2]|uniref:Kinase-like protein n=1 Tax=Coniophora puteana (strain RWD-64-598) TaxID=741705 RepID=A0A5M3MNZ1_CONPW|nr:kinase-like protein [Coniophora puteana RWD-64-598 SS2]EIW80813.1 kinase-like protein [Coniophora puteana RWD-64-598 SS2]
MTFSSEVTVWSHLRHPNILPLIGVVQQERTLCFVSPYLSHGNIRMYLGNNPGANRSFLAVDVAQALDFLHSLEPPIVHTDIKGDNILVSDAERACLIDFGFSTAKDTLQVHVTSTMESARSTPWTAPEILNGDTTGHHSYTLKSDMYAFGGVCYELFCGKIPFFGCADGTIIFRIMTGQNPDRINTRYVDDGVWSFIEECWNKEPTERPTAHQAVEFFNFQASDAGEIDIRPAMEWDYSA